MFDKLLYLLALPWAEYPRLTGVVFALAIAALIVMIVNPRQIARR